MKFAFAFPSMPYPGPYVKGRTLGGGPDLRTLWSFLKGRLVSGKQAKACLTSNAIAMNDIQSHADRAAPLKQMRELKMARSAHAYVRGSTKQFYRWLNSPAGTALPSGPPVWICGDCHVGNLGPIAPTAGYTVIEVRDLDQTVIGNPAHDLVRLALSPAMSARSSDLPGVTTARMTEDLVAGYEAAFAGEGPSEEVNGLPNPLRFVMKKAIRRNQRALLDERLGERRRHFKLGRRFWALTDDERQALRKLAASEEMRKMVAQLDTRHDDSTVSLIDAAYWVKGCSSLGLWRAAMLIEVCEPANKKKKKRTLSLLDVKQAVSAISPELATVSQDPAMRVLTGAQHISPALGKRMMATALLERSVFVRELLPQDLKVELDEISREDGRAVAYYLGGVVGKAHARQMTPDERVEWRSEMMRRRNTQIDAPGWLWEAVVDLVAVHEKAYLQHCRRYALHLDTED